MHRTITVVIGSITATLAVVLIATYAVQWSAETARAAIGVVFVVAALLTAGPPLVAMWVRALMEQRLAQAISQQLAAERIRDANAQLYTLTHPREEGRRLYAVPEDS